MPPCGPCFCCLSTQQSIQVLAVGDVIISSIGIIWYLTELGLIISKPEQFKKDNLGITDDMLHTLTVFLICFVILHSISIYLAVSLYKAAKTRDVKKVKRWMISTFICLLAGVSFLSLNGSIGVTSKGNFIPHMLIQFWHVYELISSLCFIDDIRNEEDGESTYNAKKSRPTHGEMAQSDEGPIRTISTSTDNESKPSPSRTKSKKDRKLKDENNTIN